MALTNPFEAEVFNERWYPYSGFHDEHRGKDRTPDYRPAVQQARDEFYALVEVLRQRGTRKMLQLGLGATAASHELWRVLFAEVVTIDIQVCLTGDIRDGSKIHAGLNTHRLEAIRFAERFQPYDFLFIDAGHKYDDVRMDFKNYSRMVRPGGVIAFHDALKRPTYEEEIEVWKFLDTLRDMKLITETGAPFVNMIGTEIGTAWVAHP